MVRDMAFDTINEIEKELKGEAPAAKAKVDPSWRKKRRSVEPTVQMSVRMKEPVYESFRNTCDSERMTNGDMLERLLKVYERALASGLVKKFEDV